jgi:cytochrome P450
MRRLVHAKIFFPMPKVVISETQSFRGPLIDKRTSLDWHEMVLKDAILDLFARLSARVFLGDEEVGHNASWLRITKEYTVDSFCAAYELRTYPKFLRPVIHWFLPSAQKVRAQLREAESIITPVIERRRAEKASTTTDSHGTVERSDSIEWLEKTAQEKKLKYQAAALQLSLAISAIHTTTDLLTHTMYELLKNPDIIRPLRDEIVSVVSDGGLQHSSLYNLKLMDSVIKEAQRLKPAMSGKPRHYHTGSTLQKKC